MRIVFLDFDGVIVTRQTKYLSGDPVAVAFLNRITDLSGARIVVSSAWRIGKDVKCLRRVLKRWGVTGEVIDRTPHGSGYRGWEIDEWLRGRSVSSFVILDDNNDMDPHRDHLVQTDLKVGLEEHHVQKALKILIGN